MIGRDILQKEYYKVIDWQDRLYYLICDGRDEYRWVRCYDCGKVIDNFTSKSDPLEFIHNQVRAINIETSTGVKLIKQLKRLPFDASNND